MDHVTFGVDVDIRENEYLPNPEHWGWDSNIYYIPDNWRTFSVNVPSYRSHVAIKTGLVSNITIVDASTMTAPAEFYAIIPRHIETIYNVSTRNHSKQYHFEYEPELHSIYSTRPGVTVLNDDRFAITSGREYSTWDKVPITKMPREMLKLLLQWQNEREDIHLPTYALLSILPNEWIIKDEYFINLAEALGSLLGPSMTAATLRKLSSDKIGYVDERRLRILLDCRLTSAEFKSIIKIATVDDTLERIDVKRLRLLVDTGRRKFTYTALKKSVKIFDEKAYSRWVATYTCKRSTTKVIPSLPFRFYQGAIAKLSDLKAVHPGITGPKLLAMNPAWTISPKKVCTHCKRRHYKGCCSAYSRASCITCSYVLNIEIMV
jgi:hypothetical protein